MSRNRRSKGGWADGDPNLPKGPNGRVLCRWCQEEIPRGRRRTFCSQACVDEFLVRSNPQYARRLVGRRDLGCCALCGLDTEFLREIANWLNRLANKRWHYTKDATGRWPRMAEEFDTIPASGDARAEAALESLSRAFFGRYERTRWSVPDLVTDHLWEADHIVPVVEGGGECGLDGLRTLCLPCHKAETARLRRRLAGYPEPTGAQLPLLAS